jgi:hypothetical protein
MNRILKSLGIALVLLCLGLTLVIGYGALNRMMKQQDTRRSLTDIAAIKLPKSQDFEVSKISSFDFSATESGGSCHYSRDFFAIGTSLPELLALDTYVNYLQLLGWTPRERQYPTSRVMYFEENTLLAATTNEQVAELRDSVEFAQMREDYHTVILRLEFMLPSRDEC